MNGAGKAGLRGAAEGAETPHCEVKAPCLQDQECGATACPSGDKGGGMNMESHAQAM